MRRSNYRHLHFRFGFEQLELRRLLATFFVATDGDNANSGAMSSPFGTIAHAVALAQPGDTVLIRGGTYRETIATVRSGLNTAPITIESYDNESVFVSANDVVSGPWIETAPGTGIYSASVSGSLPTKFWNNPSSAITESDGSLSIKVVNDSTYGTQSLNSAASSSSWNFFSSSHTWKIRGLSMQSIGATPLPLASATTYFSIKPSTSGAWEGEDSINVFLNGSGRLSFQPKKNQTNSWGTSVGSVVDPTITGFDLTLGPGNPGHVQYSLIAIPSGQTVATGQWAATQQDWSDGVNGSTSQLNIFAQEQVVTTDLNQQFEIKVGSYEIISNLGASTVLRDDFSNGDPANVEYYPAGRDITISSAYDQIFVDGQMQQEARFPNNTSNDLLAPSTAILTVNKSFQATSSAFASQPVNFFAGSRFLARVDPGWAWQSSKVTSSSGNTLQLDSASISNPWWPDAGSNPSEPGIGYVFGKREFLDVDKEWFLQQNSNGPDSLFLRIDSGANPSSRTVEKKSRNWTVNVNGHDNIVIRGLKLRGGAIRLNGSGLVMEDNDARYLSHYLNFTNGYSEDGGRTEGGGVVVNGANNLIRHNAIYDTAGSGILVNGTNNVITRNRIFNIDYSGTYATGLALRGAGHEATFNTIHDGGRDIIRPSGQAIKVMYNDISKAGRMALDVGLIYSFGVNGADASGNLSRIAYNWVHELGNPLDYLSNGIYLDNYTRNFIVDHNVVWNFSNHLNQLGFRINAPADGHQFYHNTLVATPQWNQTTWDPMPDSAPDPYWTTANNHLFSTSQNNLIIPTSTNPSTVFENYATQDFRLKSGNPEINPSTFTGLTQWTTPNGVTNVPASFKLYQRDRSIPFSYREVTGNGVAITGINDGFIGATPDNGAYESGTIAWRAGVAGFASGDLGIVITSASLLGGSATLGGTLQSIGSGASSAIVDAFWGTSDGGENPLDWQNQGVAASAITGLSVPVSRQIFGLQNGQIYWYRLRATNTLGQELWTEPRSFTVSNVRPTNITLNGNTINENLAGANIGSMTVSDADLGDSHALTVNDPRFEIVNGFLRLKGGQQLDFEASPTIPLDITATDLGDLSFTKTFTIAVNDLLEMSRSVRIKDGQLQRSNINLLKVTFDRPITVDVGAFRVDLRTKDLNGNLVLTAVTTTVSISNLPNGESVATLSFSGAQTRTANNWLVDGNYQLVVDGSMVRKTSTNEMFDGDKNPSTPGGDYVFGATAADRFFAQFGNMTDDRMINATDFSVFRRAFNRRSGQQGYQQSLDFNGDGIIDSTDFSAFRRNYARRLRF